MTSQVNIRVDNQTKVEVEQLFNSLGLNVTTAVNMFFKKCLKEQGIPFDLKVDPKVVTQEAIEKVAEDILDKHIKAFEVLAK